VKYSTRQHNDEWQINDTVCVHTTQCDLFDYYGWFAERGGGEGVTFGVSESNLIRDHNVLERNDWYAYGMQRSVSEQLNGEI